MWLQGAKRARIVIKPNLQLHHDKVSCSILLRWWKKHFLAKSTRLFGHMLSIALYNAFRKKKRKRKNLERPSVQFIGNFLFCILELNCSLCSPETNYEAQHENQAVLPLKKLSPFVMQGEIAKIQT